MLRLTARRPVSERDVTTTDGSDRPLSIRLEHQQGTDSHLTEYNQIRILKQMDE